MATRKRRSKAELQAALREQEARQARRKQVTTARIAVLEAVEALNKLRNGR